MKNSKGKKERLKEIRTGVRLRVKPPKLETPATVYNRKMKHKRRIEPETSSFFCINGRKIPRYSSR